MYPILRVQLFGRFCLTYDDDIIPVTSIRLQSLLAYLALHGHMPQPRRHLAYLFWAETSEAQARTNLRQLLHHLRRRVPFINRFLYDDGHDLTWRTDAALISDVDEFEAALARTEQEKQADQTAQQDLKKAIDLYQGDLVPDCYDEWILPERERLRQKYIKAIRTLVHLLEEARNYECAIQYAQLLNKIDQLDEDAYGILMRLYALNGNRSEAIKTYHICVAVLSRELGVEPADATRRIYEGLQAETKPPSAVTAEPSTVTEPTLVGRKQEWKQLLATWRTVVKGCAHLLVLCGEAGIGKTRLAEEWLTWAARQGIATATARVYAAEGRLAYAPVTSWLRCAPLSAASARLDLIWQAELVRLLPELRQGHPDLPEPPPMRESWQQLRFFDALTRAFLTHAAPLVLLLDDIQWCDQETLAWLRYILHCAPNAPLLVVATQRTEEVEREHLLRPWLYELRGRGR